MISTTSFSNVRAVQLDPVDLHGLPRISADQTVWVPPKFLPISGKGILFLDELTSVPQTTLAGCYQLVLDRCHGDYRLPDDWVAGLRPLGIPSTPLPICREADDASSARSRGNPLSSGP